MKTYCLEVSGDFACFTRPEMKVERVSYDVITPSAARAVFEAVLWKPAIRWQVSKIEVLKPIKWINLRRNEVGSVASTRNIEGAMKSGKGHLGMYIEDERQQRAGLFLRDVEYRLHASFELCDPSLHKPNFPHLSKQIVNTGKTAMDDEPDQAAKFMTMFERRAGKGQCVNQPYWAAVNLRQTFDSWSQVIHQRNRSPRHASWAICCTTWTIVIPQTPGRAFFEPAW